MHCYDAQTPYLKSFQIHRAHLLGELSHVDGFDLSQGGEPLEPLLGLLLDGDDKCILHVTILG